MSGRNCRASSAGQRQPARDFVLPRDVSTPPTQLDIASPAISISPGGRALLRCDSSPRSLTQSHGRLWATRRGFGPGAFYSFASRREFGDQTTRDNADAFHVREHGALNVQDVGKGFQDG